VDQPLLFTAVPAISADGTLTFTPAPQVAGTATVTVRLHDSGGSVDGGLDTSAAQTFSIGTSPVNDPPSFTKGADQSTANDSGPQSFPAWAKNISAGPVDEAAQAVNFLVEAADASLFSAAPAITPEGTLTFTPTPGASGSTTVTVRLHDDGGTADGGVDTSAAQTFKISISTFAEELGTYHGLVQAVEGTVLDATHFGAVRVTVAAKGVFTGQIQVGVKKYRLRGSFDHAGDGHFGAAKTATITLTRTAATSLVLSLKLDVTDGTDQVTGTLTEDGQPFADLLANRALYSSAKKIVAPKRAVPTEMLGAYTVVFAAKTPAELGLAAEQYPQGHGVGRLTVSRSGVATLSGYLADGTSIRCSSPLSKSNTWPLFVPLVRGKGSISGWITFADGEGISDLAGMGLHWYRPAATGGRYAAGWASGIEADLLGTKYTMPPKTEKRSVLPGLPAADTDGNAELTLSGRSLPAPGTTRAAFNISESNVATPLAASAGYTTMKITASTGYIRGTYIDPVTGHKSLGKAVILQKQQRAAGYLLMPTDSAALTLVPTEHPALP
jgi:hypothetical protein